MPRQRFKQRPRPRRVPILSTLLVFAFCAFAPTALAEPADEQYNFNPPSPGGDGGESTSGGPSGSSSGPGTPGPLGESLTAADDNSSGGKNGTNTGEGAADPLQSGTDSSFNPAAGSSASDESAFSAVTDTLGRGAMPILLAAMAAIGIGGLSLALYRRRERDAQTEAF